MIDEILSGSVEAGSFKAWMVYVIGCLIYFAIEYKTKSTEGKFNFTYWLMDNLPNIMVGGMAAILYNTGNEMVKVSVLIGIATMGNWLIDAFLTWRYNRLNR